MYRHPTYFIIILEALVVNTSSNHFQQKKGTPSDPSFSSTAYTLELTFSSSTIRRRPMAGDGDCARCCFSFVFTSGLAALFLWLSLRPSKPNLYIEEFSVPGLNNSGAARNNHSILLKLGLRNQMKDKGVGYADISLLFLYNSTLLVANHTLPAFYQGHGKTAHRTHAVEAEGVPWAAAAALSTNGSVRFRVRAATRVKFKIMLWFTKSHALRVAGDVEVGPSGRNVVKKSIKLKSGVAGPRSRWLTFSVATLFTFFIL
ncbi:protein NDR1-like [Salvia splendens]|uniref:protein NDR1-like n=1 Tax=Salvia splendens TaxID=180675 RepID=UPI001C252425|nr:protein NDR1-like [Salvia splendens]